jgi:L-idonate 5-dehydrogenase
MKACVVLGARQLTLSDLPDPTPGPGEALIRLGAGGICGSDLHYFAEGGVGDFRLREPLVLGHEVAGQVVAVGPGVQHVQPGDRVAVNPSHPCGRCPQCRRNRRNLCAQVRFFGSAARYPHVQGAFAELFVAAENNCFKIPDEVSDRAAACAEPLAVALHAVEQAGPILGRTVFIAGAGPIGVLLAAAARMAGAGDICVTDLFDEPLAIARAMGATETVNVAADAAALERYRADRGTFDVAFEASGHPAGLASAIEVAASGATVVQVGMLPRGATSAPLNPVVTKELRMIGSFRFDAEYAVAVAAIAGGRINVNPLLTQDFPFADLATAFAMAADRRKAMKVSLRPS